MSANDEVTSTCSPSISRHWYYVINDDARGNDTKEAATPTGAINITVSACAKPENNEAASLLRHLILSISLIKRILSPPAIPPDESNNGIMRRCLISSVHADITGVMPGRKEYTVTYNILILMKTSSYDKYAEGKISREGIAAWKQFHAISIFPRKYVSMFITKLKEASSGAYHFYISYMRRWNIDAAMRLKCWWRGGSTATLSLFGSILYVAIIGLKHQF